MIASVRESDGLGSPPIAYTTNRNESTNNIARADADYYQSIWVQLANNMFDLLDTQSKETEKQYAVWRSINSSLLTNPLKLEIAGGS